MPLSASGLGGLAHDPETHALLLTAERWALTPGEGMGEPGSVTLSGCRAPLPLSVVGGDGPPAFECAYRPVRLTLPYGSRLLVVNAELSGDTEYHPDFEALCTSLAVPDADAMDAWESPHSTVLPLGDGQRWAVRAYPRPKRLARWYALLETEGATPASWFELLAAYDGGWTLDGVPSPAQMKRITGWNKAPRTAVEAVGDFLAATVAGVLAPTPEEGEGATPSGAGTMLAERVQAVLP